jgi:hypothetical protein
MRPADIVQLPKVVTEPGLWKVTTGVSKMPPTAYPMSRRASLRLGRGWHWRVDGVASQTFSYRLLTTFQSDREEFLGWLSTQEDEGLRVIARYEFHGTHPGWHCHTAPCDHEEIPIGDPRPRLFERGVGPDDDKVFVHSEADALAKSFGFFHVTAAPEGALI